MKSYRIIIVLLSCFSLLSSIAASIQDYFPDGTVFQTQALITTVKHSPSKSLSISPEIIPAQNMQPKPTQPTPILPPPANPNQARVIIGLGVIAVIIILLGLWMNIRHIP